MSKRHINHSLHSNFFSFQRFPEEIGQCLHLYSAFIQSVLLWLSGAICVSLSPPRTLQPWTEGASDRISKPLSGRTTPPAETQPSHSGGSKCCLIAAIQVQLASSGSISAYIHTWLGQTGSWEKKSKQKRGEGLYFQMSDCAILHNYNKIIKQNDWLLHNLGCVTVFTS